MTALPLVRLKDLVLDVSSWNPLRSDGEEEFEYIDLSAVNQEHKAITDARIIKCSDAPSRARQLVKKGDVLVSTVRPNLNGVALVSGNFDGATVSTGFCVVRPKPDLLLASYLFDWVKTESFINSMVQQATGASYPAVSDRIVLDSKIPLPPLPEQRRIAAILDQTDALRAKRREALAQLDRLAQSIFVEMFGDPASNPKRLAKSSIGDLVKVRSGNFLPASEMESSGPYPVFGGNGINGYHDEYMFDDRKIVIGRVGVYCGCVHMTPATCWVTDNALYVSEYDKKVDFDFLAYSLKLANLNQYASQSAQPLISGARIYPVEILVPPAKQQAEFIARVNASKKFEGRFSESLTELDALFASLQHRAFRGDL